MHARAWHCTHVTTRTYCLIAVCDTNAPERRQRQRWGMKRTCGLDVNMRLGFDSFEAASQLLPTARRHRYAVSVHPQPTDGAVGDLDRMRAVMSVAL